MDEIKTCETCAYWDGGSSDELGCRDCHRYPPTILLVDYVTSDGTEVHLRAKGGDVPYVTYPRTNEDDWCGEWRADR